MRKRREWTRSPAHCLLLLSFVKPRIRDMHPPDRNWVMELGEQPDNAVDRFIEDNMVQQCSLFDLVCARYTKADLVDILRSQKIIFSGNERKIDLVRRLIEYDQEGMQRRTEGLELLVCTDEGQRFVEAYMADPGSVIGIEWTSAKEKDRMRLLRWIIAAGAGGVIEGTTHEWFQELIFRLYPIISEIFNQLQTVANAVSFESLRQLKEVSIDGIYDHQLRRVRLMLAQICQVASRLSSYNEDIKMFICSSTRHLSTNAVEARELVTLAADIAQNIEQALSRSHELQNLMAESAVEKEHVLATLYHSEVLKKSFDSMKQNKLSEKGLIETSGGSTSLDSRNFVARSLNISDVSKLRIAEMENVHIAIRELGQQVKELHEQYRQLLETSADCVLLFELRMRVLEIRKSGGELIEWSRLNELSGQRDSDTVAVGLQFFLNEERVSS